MTEIEAKHANELLHPLPGHPYLFAALHDLLELGSRMDPESIGRAVCAPLWRHRLVGQCLGALYPYPGHRADLLRSFAGGGDRTVQGAAAALATMAIRDGSGLSSADFPPRPDAGGKDAVGSAIAAAVEYVRTRGTTKLPGNAFAAQFEPHVRFHEWIAGWTGRRDEFSRMCRESTQDHWKGRDRACPRCAVRFRSVQNLGGCPSCRHRFYASAPELPV